MSNGFQIIALCVFACAMTSYTINAINLVTNNDMYFMLRAVGVIIAPLGMILGVLL